MIYRLLYPNFKKKAVTFSYDDGILQDVEVIKILNKYGLKGTFNLNSGKSGDPKTRLDKDGKQIDCSHLVLKDHVDLYKGHEVASHTKHHPHLETLGYDEQKEEYASDLKDLEKLFGYKIEGSAYPFGTYDQNTTKALRELGVRYGRTTHSTYRFDPPIYWLLWHPTIHHRDPLLWDILSRFYKSKKELACFYLWGHGYEFAIDHNFSLLDEFCQSVTSKSDIYNGTNLEIYNYTHAATMLYYRDGHFVNPSEMTIYFTVGGKNYSLNPGERLEYSDGK